MLGFNPTLENPEGQKGNHMGHTIHRRVSGSSLVDCGLFIRAAPAFWVFLRQAGAVISSPIYPQSSQPRPGSHSSGGYGRGGHSPAAPAGAGSISTPLGDHPTSDGTHTRPRPPLCPGHVGPALIQPLYRTDARDVT